MLSCVPRGHILAMVHTNWHGGFTKYKAGDCVIPVSGLKKPTFLEEFLSVCLCIEYFIPGMSLQKQQMACLLPR